MVVTAATEEAQFASRVRIARGQRLHVLRQLQFAHRGRQVQRPPQAERLGNARKQLVQRLHADGFEHGLLVLGGVKQVGHGQMRIVSLGFRSNQASTCGLTLLLIRGMVQQS